MSVLQPDINFIWAKIYWFYFYVKAIWSVLHTAILCCYCWTIEIFGYINVVVADNQPHSNQPAYKPLQNSRFYLHLTGLRYIADLTADIKHLGGVSKLWNWGLNDKFLPIIVCSVLIFLLVCALKIEAKYKTFHQLPVHMKK